MTFFFCFFPPRYRSERPSGRGQLPVGGHHRAGGRLPSGVRRLVVPGPGHDTAVQRVPEHQLAATDRRQIRARLRSDTLPLAVRAVRQRIRRVHQKRLPQQQSEPEVELQSSTLEGVEGKTQLGKSEAGQYDFRGDFFFLGER